MGKKPLAVLLMLVPCMGAAQVRRGDTGAEVLELQQMLLGTGWLFEEPDGVFGRRTEQAVRQYEEHTGMRADGIADDDMLASLRKDYALMTGVLPEGGLGEDTPLGICIHLTAADGSSEVVYCVPHADLYARSSALLAGSTVDQARQACALWREEILQLYARWTDCTEESLHEDIRQAETAFFAMIDAQEQAIARYYGTFQIDPGEAAPYAGLEIVLREHAAWLCALISGSLTGHSGAPEL